MIEFTKRITKFGIMYNGVDEIGFQLRGKFNSSKIESWTVCIEIDEENYLDLQDLDLELREQFGITQPRLFKPFISSSNRYFMTVKVKRELDLIDEIRGKDVLLYCKIHLFKDSSGIWYGSISV
jgi:hypothetical protein